MLSVFAAAKINLCLKVLGRRADGYHDLESLVAFADIGDRLILKKSETAKLSIVGPFAAALDAEDEANSVLQAVKFLERETGRALSCELVLEKNLPVASGIGGGSADAAATLRGICELYDLPVSLDDLADDLAAELGADVPVCLEATPAWMSGIGQHVERPLSLSASDVILVNPRIGVSTAEIFSALNASALPMSASSAPNAFDGPKDMLGFLQAQGNDLQAVAVELVPEIALCLSALREAGAPYCAMSGSGATCFALCPPGQAKAMAARYRTVRDKDWVMSGRLIGAGD